LVGLYENLVNSSTGSHCSHVWSERRRWWDWEYDRTVLTEWI